MSRVKIPKIHKNIRLDDNIVAWIEMHGEGKNFTVKLENVLNDYIYTIQNREIEVLKLDDQILTKRNQLKEKAIELFDITNDMNKYMRKLKLTLDK